MGIYTTSNIAYSVAQWFAGDDAYHAYYIRLSGKLVQLIYNKTGG